jgi:simple sugar transport system permease protein
MAVENTVTQTTPSRGSIDPGTPSGAASRGLAGRIRWSDQLGLTIGLIVLIIVFANQAPNFLTWDNLTNILQQSSYVGIIACGMTLVILAGEIDVSVGSATALAGVVLAILLDDGVTWPLAVLLTLLIGMSIGVFAGFIRAAFLIPSFIVTLALYGALRGFALMFTDAIPQAPEAFSNSFFTFVGRGKVLGIPTPAAVLIVLFVVFWLISTKTTFGKQVYAVGGNPDAAYLAGIPIVRVRILLFATTGLLAALSGILLAASLGAGDPSTNQGLEFQVIAAVIVGGTNLFGGRGTMIGTVLGVLFIGVLGNGLVLVGIDPYANFVVQGVVILVAVLVMSSGLRDQLRDVAGRLRRKTGRGTPRP